MILLSNTAQIPSYSNSCFIKFLEERKTGQERRIADIGGVLACQSAHWKFPYASGMFVVSFAPELLQFMGKLFELYYVFITTEVGRALGIVCVMSCEIVMVPFVMFL